MQTRINAQREVVFDLARSIDLHQISAAETNEKAIAGRTSGLLELGENVTWRARHFGVYFRLCSAMTEFERPRYFVDEMVNGPFRSFRHEHHFEEIPGSTRMTDFFDYCSPLGILGRCADRLFLETYLRQFLEKRNRVIKSMAESGAWRHISSSMR